MNNDINLLPKATVGKAQKTNPKKKIFEFVSYGSLFIVAASSAMFFILASFSPITQLREEEATLLSELKTYRSEIGKHFIIKERTKAIQDILTKRNAYDIFLKELISALPEDMEINSFVFTDADLTVDFLTSSLSSVDLYLVKLKFLAADKKYKDIKISELEYDGKQGTYLLGVNFLKSIKY